MRKLPARLAAFFILITISRVAAFAVLGLKIGWLGYAFAIGLAAGVYVAAFFVRPRETRVAALFMLVMFGVADLWFNEFELIRNLSVQQLLPPTANFLNFNYDSLVRGMQISAIVYGAFPTIAAAGLGWLQSGAERVASLKTRGWFGKFGIAIAAKVEGLFPEIEDRRQIVSSSQRQLPDSIGKAEIAATKTRWENISSRQKEEIAAMTVRQIISAYGGTARTARNWKSWVKQGK